MNTELETLSGKAFLKNSFSKDGESLNDILLNITVTTAYVDLSGGGRPQGFRFCKAILHKGLKPVGMFYDEGMEVKEFINKHFVKFE